MDDTGEVGKGGTTARGAIERSTPELSRAEVTARTLGSALREVEQILAGGIYDEERIRYVRYVIKRAGTSIRCLDAEALMDADEFLASLGRSR